jgi:proline iminopeptidase
MNPGFGSVGVFLSLVGAAGCSPGDGRGNQTFPSDTGYVDAGDGVRLFYRTVGTGPLNVVIPLDLFLEQALRPLARPDRRLVFYDPRGRGRSDAGDRSRITLETQVADLEALRQALGIDSMVLIGWSGLGMEMAVYTIRHPTRVMRLVQAAPVAARDQPHNPVAYQTRAERIDTAGVRALMLRNERGEFASDPAGYCRALRALTLPASFAGSSRRGDVPDTCRFPNEYPDSLAPLFQSLLNSFAGYDWRDEVAGLTVPRLVIHGAQDAFPVEGSEEWVPPGSNARLMVISNAGHFPFLERPDLFFAAVEAFLEGRWPPP